MVDQSGLSYWDIRELQKKVDVLIVGGGITGLGAAISIKELCPNASVRVVDKWSVSRLASTRNAGFACFGSLTEIEADIDQIGVSSAMSLVQRRMQGIHRILSLCGESRIDYVQSGGYEVISREHLTEGDLIRRIDFINDHIAKFAPHATFSVVGDANRPNWLSDDYHLVFNPAEGQLNPARYVDYLTYLARQKGVAIIEGVEIVELGNLHTSGHVMTSMGSMHASKVLLATNAVSSTLLPDVPIIPARNTILMTEPLPTLDLPGNFHFHQGYIYFRAVDDRLLIGGGRHWDKEAEQTGELDENPYIRMQMLNLMRTFFFANQELPSIEYSWSGIMGITVDKSPIIQELSEGCWICAGHSGMGVALALDAGTQVGTLIAQQLL